MLNRKEMLTSLIDYMWYKQDLITNVIGLDFNYMYFTNFDADNMLNWHDDSIRYVYQNIRNNIRNVSSHFVMSDNALCPFCMVVTRSFYRNICKYCQYGKIHGVCYKNGDYRLICNALENNVASIQNFEYVIDNFFSKKV